MRTDRIIRGVVASALIMLCVIPSEAQNSTSSPYTMYGIGAITPKEDAASAGMGHSGIALAPSEWVNVSNPAGLCGLDSLAFYFNLQAKAYYAQEETYDERFSSYSANIDGITMAFRSRKWLAFALGYAPYSAVGYNVSVPQGVAGTNAFYELQYKGSGGLSQAFLGTAVTFFNHLSIGGNASVIWGNIEKLQIAYFDEPLGGENIYNERKYSVNNFFFEIGAQFDFNIGQNNFRFGAIYNRRTWLHTAYKQRIYNDVSSQLQYDDSTPDRFYIPRTYGAGFSYQRKRLLGTIEYKVAEWGDVENTKFEDHINFRDTYTISGGLQFSTGEPTDPFYKRMRYRVGGFYGLDYLDMPEANLSTGGFTLGLTVPLGRSLNAITVAYEYYKRGSYNNGNLVETYNNFKIAFNVREVWFLKSKFD